MRSRESRARAHLGAAAMAAVSLLTGAFGLDILNDTDEPLNFAVIDDVSNNLTVSQRPD